MEEFIGELISFLLGGFAGSFITFQFTRKSGIDQKDIKAGRDVIANNKEK